jgi:hypothetical protein
MGQSDHDRVAPAETESHEQWSNPVVIRPKYLEREDNMTKLNEEKRDDIGTSEFAFPKERKEPLNDATHVRNAIARFNQVEGVTDEERDEAWKRIKHAASKFKVELNESSWRELSHSHSAKK